MRRAAVLFLFLTLGFPAGAADDPDEAVVKAAGLSPDGAALLEFVRQRSREAIDKDELAPDAQGIGLAGPEGRRCRGRRPGRPGPLAVPALRRAANDLADKPRPNGPARPSPTSKAGPGPTWRRPLPGS